MKGCERIPHYRDRTWFVHLNDTIARWSLAAGLLIQFAAPLSAQPLPKFDFTGPDTAREWGSPHDIAALRGTAEGLEITINGPDPYFFGPGRNYPADIPLWLFVRLKSDQGGIAEVFYFRDHPDADKSVRFSVPAGRWTEARVPMPAMGENYRLRLDPPGLGA